MSQRLPSSQPQVSYDHLTRRLLGRDPRVRRDAPYHVIQVAGRDAREFLHRMCSQDLLSMGDGTVLPGAFLDGKGKLLALCQLGVLGDAVWVSTQSVTGASLAEMLERYHFRESLTVEAMTGWTCDELLAAGSIEGFEAGRCESVEGGGVKMSFSRGDLQTTRRHGPESNRESSNFAQLDATAAECLRIASGEPLVLTDSEPNTLALELPIDDHISLTKGCYTGQEIVARIQTYGHTNRSLCRLAIKGTGAIEGGTVLVELDDGDPVGRVMSAADVPGDDGRVAFGFLPSALADSGTTLALGETSGSQVVVF